MAFSYSADVPKSPAYQTTTAAAPDPIFRKLANSVDVTYTYDGKPGTVALVTKLATPSGWRWTLPEGPPVSFPGNEYTGETVLDLNALEKQAIRGTKAAGIPYDGLKIQVVPVVESADGKWEPTLDLNLSQTALTLAAGSSGSSDAKSDPLKVTQSDPVTVTTQKANTIRLLLWPVPVTFARILSVLMLVIGALMLLGAAIMIPRTRPKSEAEAIARRHKALLIEVAVLPEPAGSTVDVADFDTLARLSERYALMVMHAYSDPYDIYLLQDEAVSYRYVAAGAYHSPGDELSDGPEYEGAPEDKLSPGQAPTEPPMSVS